MSYIVSEQSPITNTALKADELCTVDLFGRCNDGDNGLTERLVVLSPVYHSDNFHSKSQRSREPRAGRGRRQGLETPRWRTRRARAELRTDERRLTRKSVFFNLFFPYFLHSSADNGQQRFAEVSDGTDRRNRKRTRHSPRSLLGPAAAVIDEINSGERNIIY